MMPEYAVHRARLMILRKIVLFQDAPVRFNDVSFSKMTPLFIRNKSAHILPCVGADKPSCFSKTDKVFAFFQISCVTINNPSARIKKSFMHSETVSIILLSLILPLVKMTDSGAPFSEQTP